MGPKTVACVMMFCLARDEFPVDTHVWRISKNMGWVPAKANREDTYSHMNIRVPADLRYDPVDTRNMPAIIIQLIRLTQSWTMPTFLCHPIISSCLGMHGVLHEFCHSTRRNM